MSAGARAALRARTPSIYLQDGFCTQDGEVRRELLDAEAIAAATQLTVAELAPQEMAFTLEALQALLPMQSGTAAERMQDSLAEALATVQRMIRQDNNDGLAEWCRACALFVRTDEDIAAFVVHMRAVLRLYALFVSLPAPGAIGGERR